MKTLTDDEIEVIANEELFGIIDEDDHPAFIAEKAIKFACDEIEKRNRIEWRDLSTSIPSTGLFWIQHKDGGVRPYYIRAKEESKRLEILQKLNIVIWAECRVPEPFKD